MATLVNEYAGGDTFAGDFNVSISAPTSGNTILIALIASTSVTWSTVSDNQSGVYTLDWNTTMGTTGTDVWFYRRSNVTDGPTNIDVTPGSSTFPYIAVFEVSGLTNTTPEDLNATGTGAFGLTPTLDTGNTGGTAGSFCLACVSSDSARTHTADASWTRATGHTGDQGQILQYLASLSGTTVDFTNAISPSDGWDTACITYLPEAGGGSILTQIMHHRKLIGVS